MNDDSAIDNLTPSQMDSRICIVAYAMYGVSKFFSWNDVTASGLFESLSKIPNVSKVQKEAVDACGSKAEYLNGVSFWIELYRQAQPWAWRLAGSYMDVEDFSDDPIGMDDGVDEYISEVAESCQTLQNIIDGNPEFHGAICLETSRHLSEIMRSIRSKEPG